MNKLEWHPYPGDYEKDFCDVVFVDGRRAFGVWPNAGKFAGRPESEVKEIRYLTEEELEALYIKHAARSTMRRLAKR